MFIRSSTERLYTNGETAIGQNLGDLPARRYPDLNKTWLAAVDRIVKSTRTLGTCRQDDRYKGRLTTLDRTLGELETARDMLNVIIEDFRDRPRQPARFIDVPADLTDVPPAPQPPHSIGE